MRIKQIHCEPSTTCSTISLEPRKIIKKSINLSLWGIFLVILIAWFLEITLGTITEDNVIIQNVLLFAYIGLLLIIFLGNLFYQFLYFRYYFYDITPEEVIIMKGVVARNRISIRYEKIQNIFIDQDFWDRIFKLYDVHLATADFQSARVAHIDGVSKENAERVKKILTENIKSRRAESGV